ncbi:MAG: nucleotide exchange factor GrpE [Clostridia bacterium]
MQNIQQEPLSQADAEAVDTLGAEIADKADEAAAAEAAKDELVQETQAAQAAEALTAAVAKQEEYLAMAQRVQADFDNFRRRNQNVRKEAFDDGTRAFATTILPVIDNLERAIAAAAESSDTSLKEGIEMVCRQLCEVFEKRGIATINRMGELFDPNLENAVMQGAPEDGEPGTVCEVFQKGYQMEGMVLRHAMVKVVPE